MEIIFGIIAVFVVLIIARKMHKKKPGDSQLIRKPNEMGAHGVYGE